MPAPRTFTSRTSLSMISSELTYTTSRLLAHPEGAPHAPQFVALREQCRSTLIDEQKLRDAIVDAQAVVDHVDDGFDGFVKHFAPVLDKLTGGDRKHPLYKHYFGSKTPSDFSRPVLGKQLEAMSAWVSSLEKSEHAELKALVPELSALIEKGKAATAGKAAADLARDQFRDVGARYAFIQLVNATRKDIYGDLAKLPHEKTGLPNHFGDRFFRREPRTSQDDGGDELTTIEAVDEALAALAKEMDALKVKRAELVAVAAAKQASAEVKEAEEALAALAKKKAEMAAEEAALMTKIQGLKQG